jgi:membrane-bound metal-dependent hydrolase YbcI (DUF457 family)
MSGLLVFVALGVYVWGSWKFWTGFNRTNFSDGKLYLTALWPVFVIANKDYRRNFSRALKGS